MAAHRYWRLSVIQPSGAYLSCRNIELRATVGGADETGSGTASASTEDGSHPAAHAFDDNESTYWLSAAGYTGQWIKYDFGAGSEKDIAEVAWKTQFEDGYAGYSQNPRTLLIEYSDNDSTWTTLRTVSLEAGWTAGETRLYTTSAPPARTTHRYWRLWITKVQDTSDTIAGAVECELRGTPGGADLTGSGTASADSIWSAGYEASKAFDNDTGTFWTTTRSDLPHFLMYDFGEGNEYDIQEVTLRSRNDSYWIQVPAEALVQYSDKPYDFQTAWEILWSKSAQDTTRTYTDPAQVTLDSTALYWRVRVIETNYVAGAPYCSAARVEFRATPGGADQCTGGTAISSADGGGADDNAFDTNINTFWASWTAYAPQYIGYGFASAVAVQEMAYTARNDGYGSSEAPKVFQVESSNDGNVWYPRTAFSGETGWSAGELRTFAIVTGTPPTAPVISAEATDVGEITVSVDTPSEDADTVALYGADDPDDLPEGGPEAGADELDPDWDETDFVETGLGNGVTRYYAAYATNDVDTVRSNVVNATTQAAPTAPVITAVATAPGTITVEMTSGGVGADTIALYGADDPDDLPEGGALPGADLLDADWDGSATPETGLGPGHYRAYRAYATNEAGTTPSNRPSATTQATPGIPVLSLAADSATQITVTFATPGTTADSHKLRWGTDPDALALYSDALSAAPAPIPFTGLEPGTTYYFQAVAVNEAGETEGSIVSIATLTPALQVAYVTNTTAGLVLQYDPLAVKVQYQVALDAETDFDPTVDDDIETNEDDNNPFGHETTGLTASTWYRARARSSATLGGAFGAWTPVVRFQTAATNPLVRMGGFTAPLSGAFLSGAQTLQWDLRTPTIYGELNVWVATQLAVSEDGENWTILAIEPGLTPAGPTGSWAINMGDYDASIVTFRVMGRRSDGKLGVAYRSFYNNDSDDPLTGTNGFSDECWEAMWVTGDGVFYRLHNPINGEMEHTIYAPYGDASFYLPCAQPTPLAEDQIVKRISASLTVSALARGGTFYWWLNEQIEGAGGAIDIYNGDGTLIATALTKFMQTWPVAPCDNPDNLTGWVQVAFSAPIEQPGIVQVSDVSSRGQGRYPGDECGVWGEALMLSVSITRQEADHSMWDFSIQGVTSKPNGLGKTRKSLTGSFKLEGDICAAYVMFRSIGIYYDEIFNSGGVIMGAGASIEYTGEPCEAPPPLPPETETGPFPFAPTLFLDVVVDCGDVTITGEFMGEEPGGLSYAELEIVRTDTDETVYGPTQRVDGSEWFFSHTTHTLPYYVPLAARMRWSDGEALSEWSDWEAFILSIAWEDCLPIWWPSVEGVRRILFGEPGVTSDGLDIETTGIRRILFGEPGD